MLIVYLEECGLDLHCALLCARHEDLGEAVLDARAVLRPGRVRLAGHLQHASQNITTLQHEANIHFVSLY